MSHHVYYFWRERTPLYIGVTGDLPRRLRQHARSPWASRATHTTAIAFEDEALAYAAEAEQIASLRPVYNVRHNPAHRSLWDAYDDCDFVPKYDLAAMQVALDRITVALDRITAGFPDLLPERRSA